MSNLKLICFNDFENSVDRCMYAIICICNACYMQTSHDTIMRLIDFLNIKYIVNNSFLITNRDTATISSSNFVGCDGTFRGIYFE